MNKQELNQVDLCFVIDTTGSMGSFIEAAKRQLLDTLELLSTDSQINLQVGLVEYRDHPPQDNSFVTRIYQLTNNFLRMQKQINQLKADGGGDAAEAVYRGVMDACQKMSWRKHSSRFIMLVGDAPPHGFAKWWRELTGNRVRESHDAWSQGCPSGLDLLSVAAAAEDRRIKVYGLCMGYDGLTRDAFGTIALQTGGKSVNARDANQVISEIVNLLKLEFSDLAFDGQVLTTLTKMNKLDLNELARRLESPRFPVATAVTRLGKRGFLT
jgi:hypothetical protein